MGRAHNRLVLRAVSNLTLGVPNHIFLQITSRSFNVSLPLMFAPPRGNVLMT